MADEPTEFTYSRSGGEPTGSALDQLRAEVSTPLPADLLPLHVPEHPNVTIVYDTRVDWDIAKTIAKQATDSRTNETDALKIAALVLAQQCQRIEMNDVAVTEADGTNLTLKSKALQDMTDCLDQVEAIRAFFGRDSDILGHQARLNERSDLDREAPDPTR